MDKQNQKDNNNCACNDTKFVHVHTEICGSQVHMCTNEQVHTFVRSPEKTFEHFVILSLITFSEFVAYTITDTSCENSLSTEIYCQ